MYWAMIGRILHFSSSSSSLRLNTYNSRRKLYISMKLCGYVGFCNEKRLVTLVCLQTTSKQQMPQALNYEVKYVAL